MTEAEKIRRPLRRAAAIGAAMAGAALLLALLLPGAEEEGGEVPTFAVRRGLLTISVTEPGTIRARDRVVIVNEVEGRTAIIFLVEEGSRVAKGDLLVELDASRLQDELVDQQIRLRNAEAEYIRAREDLAVIRNRARSEVEKAELDLRFARDDLKKYVEGEYPKALKEAESRITVVREELRRAEERLEWSQVLFAEKYLSETELQADALAAQKARLELELAQADLDLLRNFSHGRRMAELESAAGQTRMALERTRRKASADVIQAEAILLAKESEFQRQNDKLEKLRRQIEKTRIFAPADGLVIYATSVQPRRGSSEPLAEGQEVRERQELIHLPVAGPMVAEVKIHESGLDKVRVGLPVLVTVDALPGRVFTGTLERIAPLPDPVSIWLNPDLKVYDAVIQLREEDPALRTGMSCRAEIVVERYEDALYVPVQAVTRVEGTQAVLVVRDGRTAVRPVKVGLDNNRMVRILQGLEAGEKVLLTPPLAQEERPRRPEPEAPPVEAEREAAPPEEGVGR